jgi:hypothetical protein
MESQNCFPVGSVAISIYWSQIQYECQAISLMSQYGMGWELVVACDLVVVAHERMDFVVCKADFSSSKL